MKRMLRNLSRCRRGGVALMVSIMIVPVIGLTALGAEVGSWHLIRRQAQNAADAAAYAGAISLSNGDSATTAISAGTTFANTNGFNAATNCPTAGTQLVCITVSGGNTTVKAVLTQNQPTYLAALFHSAPVKIQATAKAQLNAKNDCALGVKSLTIGGNSQFTGGNCTLMTDGGVTVNGSSPNFTGPEWNVSGVTGCSGHCTLSGATSNYNASPVSLPPALTSLEASCPSESNCPMGSGWKKLNVNKAMTLPSGIYFYDSVSIGTNGNLIGNGVNIVIGSGGLSMSGNAQMTLTAGSGGTGSAAALNGVALYDTESGSIKINGNNAPSLDGAVYFPNADVTWNGNNTTGTNCTEIVAKSLTFTGNSTLSVSNCKVSAILPQYVLLTQ
jgi:Flp pilus assembly protein TadG